MPRPNTRSPSQRPGTARSAASPRPRGERPVDRLVGHPHHCAGPKPAPQPPRDLPRRPPPFQLLLHQRRQPGSRNRYAATGPTPHERSAPTCSPRRAPSAARHRQGRRQRLPGPRAAVSPNDRRGRADPAPLPRSRPRSTPPSPRSRSWAAQSARRSSPSTSLIPALRRDPRRAPSRRAVELVQRHVGPEQRGQAAQVSPATSNHR
jgi:hypothetical protein